MKRLRKLLTVLTVLVTLVVGVLFALQNTIPVPLDLLVYTFEPQSIALWILVAFALGGLLGMIVSAAILVRTHADALVDRHPCATGQALEQRHRCDRCLDHARTVWCRGAHERRSGGGVVCPL